MADTTQIDKPSRQPPYQLNEHDYQRQQTNVPNSVLLPLNAKYTSDDNPATGALAAANTRIA
jgi:hypothetical protein